MKPIILLPELPKNTLKFFTMPKLNIEWTKRGIDRYKIKLELHKMLVREKRIEIFNKCLDFLDTRVELDQKGFKEDIFEH